ncbi:MAG: hypothetical protein JJU46_11835 [Balneolaceae bacterium]|nr:hypothetical protein [Balneolaceae bacterium]MCH8547964.1 hypothetical protein [Balneolaceae bacterium]
MTTNQTVWLISIIVLLVCLLAALLIYIYTGNVILALIVAPPIIHWILRRKTRSNREY